MKITQLEVEIIRRFLADRDLDLSKRTVVAGEVNVLDRSFSGIGFMTEFEKTNAMRVFEDSRSLRWGKVGARLNANRVETGYLVYVDDGYVTALEGYTYGGLEWPSKVNEIECYDFDPRQ